MHRALARDFHQARPLRVIEVARQRDFLQDALDLAAADRAVRFLLNDQPLVAGASRTPSTGQPLRRA